MMMMGLMEALRGAGVGERWAAMGSTIASIMFFWAIIQRYFPPGIRRKLESLAARLTTHFDPFVKITINEFKRNSMKPHLAFSAVEAYLSNVDSLSRCAKRLKAEISNGKMALSMEEDETITDDFRGIQVSWSSGAEVIPGEDKSEQKHIRLCRLTFHRRDWKLITGEYMDHVLRTGEMIISKNRKKKLYTNGQGRFGDWSHVAFKHPANFHNLALDPKKKQDIMDDLENFAKGKEFYDSVGKPWKRGYLLYGPPGTGKSTMISAMANLLNYDVYDLELTSVKDNMHLRRLLNQTTSKSIVVIEDIDCSLNITGLRDQNKGSEDNEKEMSSKAYKKEGGDQEGSKVTLSGLLNVIDGIWSPCGEEKIFVFTTNHVERLDPALTRRGRMDRHIELSYCTFEGFKVLARNYLKIEKHWLFEPIKKLIEERNITPADVAENLMPKSKKENVDKSLRDLVEALEAKNVDVDKKNRVAVPIQNGY